MAVASGGSVPVRMSTCSSVSARVWPSYGLPSMERTHAHTAAQRTHRLLHALELLGVRVATDLRSQPLGHTVVVLAQLQSVVLSRLE